MEYILDPALAMHLWTVLAKKAASSASLEMMPHSLTKDARGGPPKAFMPHNIFLLTLILAIETHAIVDGGFCVESRSVGTSSTTLARRPR